ncbi:MAG: MFS transporter, partial [Hyphomicrobium sp.]|nr:MFS transporter [Hyphomicrobium sp.]
LPPEQLKNASGLFNLTRNLGGAVGLALINTLLNKRLDLHLARLHEQVAWGHPAAEDQLSSMQQTFSNAMQADGDMAALKKLAMMVRMQANVLSFADLFLVLTVMFATAALFTVLMRKPQEVAGAAGGGH